MYSVRLFSLTPPSERTTRVETVSVLVLVGNIVALNEVVRALSGMDVRVEFDHAGYVVCHCPLPDEVVEEVELLLA